MQSYSAEATRSHLEVVKSMEGFVRENLPQLLKTVDQSWQPSSFLPAIDEENWQEEVNTFRTRAKVLPDDLLVVLVGNMITEEALPSYQTWINLLEGVNDPSGEGENPWGQWSRGWTAEEKRHGDLLNKYLYLTGRVDTFRVEKTIQHLIRNGFNPGTENDPYLGFVYTSFQERATQVSHRNTAVLAGKSGESQLQLICGTIAGDEARHGRAYELFMKKIFELDPQEATLAFYRMMKKRIIMPARLMNDGDNSTIFEDYSSLAQKLGVYTSHDYADIVEDLVRSWGIANISGLSGEAVHAQEYLCTFSDRIKKLADRRAIAPPKNKFSWIFHRI